MLYEISQGPLGDYVVTPLDVDEYDRWMRSATRTILVRKRNPIALSVLREGVLVTGDIINILNMG